MHKDAGVEKTTEHEGKVPFCVLTSDMEKFTEVNSSGLDAERDLPECGDAGEPLRENGKAGAGQNGSVTRAQTSSPRMLVGLDILCLIVASIPFFACELKTVKPYKRGFFCGDQSITYPYLEREVIPDSVLITGGMIITGLTIALAECYCVRSRRVNSRAFIRNPYVSSLYKELGSFLFGGCIGQSLTNMAKLSVGRLRPNFLAVCNVTYASLNCSDGDYVDTVKCNSLGKSEDEARKSFFSGHASFAMYTMLYLAFYLQAKFSWHGARLLRPLLQFLLIMLAIYTGLTRISDYRHHPSDVLTGFLQGGFTAYWVAFHISPMFKTCPTSRSPTSLSLDSPLSMSSRQTEC